MSLYGLQGLFVHFRPFMVNFRFAMFSFRHESQKKQNQAALSFEPNASLHLVKIDYLERPGGNLNLCKLNLNLIFVPLQP